MITHLVSFVLSFERANAHVEPLLCSDSDHDECRYCIHIIDSPQEVKTSYSEALAQQSSHWPFHCMWTGHVCINSDKHFWLTVCAYYKVYI